jgi:hypothetical protein
VRRKRLGVIEGLTNSRADRPRGEGVTWSASIDNRPRGEGIEARAAGKSFRPCGFLGCFDSPILDVYSGVRRYPEYQDIALNRKVPSSSAERIIGATIFGIAGQWASDGRAYLDPLGIPVVIPTDIF